MNIDLVRKYIATITAMKEKGIFGNYIDYIVFPHYKNLVPYSRINFDFPLTVLVGKNGSGKSSTLHALFGAPLNHSVSDFWFSTKVDPIDESGNRARFFYGYKTDLTSSVKEVMKTRIRKSDDPDYWETSRPLKRDGMKGERYSPVEKNVVYLDFRAEVSAFDKTLHFSEGDIDARKKLLREKSIYLNRIFNEEPVRLRGRYAKEIIGKMEVLDSETVKIISSILNKEYTEIRVAEHRLYHNNGTSVLLKTKHNGRYSEANAGSGEIAVVQMVRKIEDANDNALILLDEPEVSLHPGAQENMKQYLLQSIIKKKLQIIISTHSPSLISELPNTAIKLFKTNEEGAFYIQEDVNYQEAFFNIEDKIDSKKIIYCEDLFAKTILDKVIKYLNKENFIEVIFRHGGVKTLVNHHLPTIALNNDLVKYIYFVLDGDMYTGYEFDECRLPLGEEERKTHLEECLKNAYGMIIDSFPDGSKDRRRLDQIIDDYIKYLRFYNSNVRFLPINKIPEEIVLASSFVKKHYNSILDKYDHIGSKNAKDIVKEISEFEHGDDLHYTDTLDCLAYKWSQEESDDRSELIDVINEIYNA